MPSPEITSSAPERTTCPLCEAPLDPQQPTACSRCDWVSGYRRKQEQSGGTGRDLAAALMSVVPGLGHFYKGHRISGMLFMIGGIFAIFACGLVATATAGFGLLLLPIYWAGVMMQVYWLEDLSAAKSSS